MNLTLVTVVFDPETGAFPPSPLDRVEGEVVSVVEHFFAHAGLPHLLLVVHHRPPSVREQTGRARPHVQGGAPTLTDEERAVFDRLRAWRQGRAQADGVPVYVVMNNAQLAEIARRCPTSLSSLRQVEGIGDSKAGRYGKDVLEVVTGKSTPSSQAAPIEEESHE